MLVITSRDAARKDMYNSEPLFGYNKLPSLAACFLCLGTIIVCCSLPPYHGGVR